MGALTDFWKSERGLLAVLLIIAVTVLAAMGNVTFAEWREYTLYIFGGYTVAKTITGTAQVIKGFPPTPSAPAAPAAPASPASTP